MHHNLRKQCYYDSKPCRIVGVSYGCSATEAFNQKKWGNLYMLKTLHGEILHNIPEKDIRIIEEQNKAAAESTLYVAGNGWAMPVTHSVENLN